MSRQDPAPSNTTHGKSPSSSTSPLVHRTDGNSNNSNNSHEHPSHSSSHHTGAGGLLTIHHEGESGRSGMHLRPFAYILWRSSSQVSMLVNVLWPFVPAAIILHYLPGDHTATLDKWIFATAYVGMVPCANLLGFAGQELARKLPKVAGILIETALGSIVEIVLFMILIAKHREADDNDDTSAEEGNLIPVIQAAILGSIVTNLLLCLGLCFFVGGLRQHTQTFHAVVSEVGSGLLLVAGFGLAIPSAFYSALKGETATSHNFTRQKLQDDVLQMSRATSVILMVAFAIYIFFNARSQHGIFDEILEADERQDADHAHDLTKEKLTLTECVVAIAASLTLVTLLAVFLVERIEVIVRTGGVPDQFLGLILLPLVEKAAEHLTAVDEAWDGQMNFALYHCLGPSIQTALFNGPLVVVVAWILDKPMDLNFEIFMVALLVLAILVVGNFLRDKESNYLEGALLVIVYIIIAIAAWYYPDPDVATSNEFDGIGAGAGAVVAASNAFKVHIPSASASLLQLRVQG
ncbi:calcium/proton exchanger [Cladophialophora carrionii CBS 160.54]|uniref:Calcium/proton exchanger n=1 Tax=Cladophialophora carrionii CBS 160.54 TaxID=1279043 RepID=V9D1A5_9EURO|nr:calcium/proton exchanger [Cladophialophora carrionii CBS 160.54]ETI20396.1 calcium/proton exchanger [Cladophialophora carrionii CBS 160.54]